MGWEGGRHCILDQKHCSGGDCLLTRCLQMYFDLAHTDPGPGLLHQSREWILFDNPLRECVPKSAERLVKGGIGKQCQWLVKNGVSFHVSVRGMGLENAPGAVRNITRAYQASLAYLHALDA
jgi:hypothetical protein